MTLTYSTNVPHIDLALRSIVRMIETAFPAAIRSYYLTGSYADSTAVAASDLDVTLIVRDSADDITLQHVRQFIDDLSEICGIPLDIHAYNSTFFSDPRASIVKLGSVLLFGDDIRDVIGLPSIDEWKDHLMRQIPYWVRVARGKSETLPSPLTYPKGDDEFFGYLELEELPDRSSKVESTKLIVVMIGWFASALLAQKADIRVARKRDCQQQYKLHIADEWTDLIEFSYTTVRGKWNYRVPSDMNDRNTLRALCQRLLEFEQYALAQFHASLALSSDITLSPIS